MENMEEALQEARKSLYEFSEVPVGCVFIYENEIIARGHNLVNKTKNSTRHAEFVCIDITLDYCKEKKLNYRDVFKEITVYVTVEPCIMCSHCLYELKVKEIVYGCKNDRFGGSTVVQVSNFIEHVDTKIQGGLLETEAMDLLKKFYQMENQAAPMPAKRR